MEMLDLKSKWNKIKNSLGGHKIGLEIAVEESANLKINQQKLFYLKNRDRKKIKKNNNFRNLWDNIKGYNIHIIGFHQERRERGREIFKELMTLNFPRFFQVCIFTKLTKTQAVIIQRKSYLITSWSNCYKPKIKRESW